MPLREQARRPPDQGGRADDYQQRTEENKGSEPPVHLPPERIRVALRGAPNDELGASRLGEVKVLPLSLYDVGKTLQEIDELLVVDGYGRLR